MRFSLLLCFHPSTTSSPHRLPPPPRRLPSPPRRLSGWVWFSDRLFSKLDLFSFITPSPLRTSLLSFPTLQLPVYTIRSAIWCAVPCVGACTSCSRPPPALPRSFLVPPLNLLYFGVFSCFVYFLYSFVVSFVFPLFLCFCLGFLSPCYFVVLSSGGDFAFWRLFASLICLLWCTGVHQPLLIHPFFFFFFFFVTVLIARVLKIFI